MVDLTEYIQEKYIINRNLYESIKDSVTCAICSNIIINPTVCMNCQKAYCRNCITHWNNLKHYCPYKCDNSKYNKSIVVANLLSKLNFTCKDCFNIVNYDKMEKHVLSQCDTVEVNYKLNENNSNDDGIFQRLDIDTKYKKNIDSQIRTKMKSKYIYFLSKFYF